MNTEIPPLNRRHIAFKTICFLLIITLLWNEVFPLRQGFGGQAFASDEMKHALAVPNAFTPPCKVEFNEIGVPVINWSESDETLLKMAPQVFLENALASAIVNNLTTEEAANLIDEIIARRFELWKMPNEDDMFLSLYDWDELKREDNRFILPFVDSRKGKLIFTTEKPAAGTPAREIKCKNNEGKTFIVYVIIEGITKDVKYTSVTREPISSSGKEDRPHSEHMQLGPPIRLNAKYFNPEPAVSFGIERLFYRSRRIVNQRGRVSGVLAVLAGILGITFIGIIALGVVPGTTGKIIVAALIGLGFVFFIMQPQKMLQQWLKETGERRERLQGVLERLKKQLAKINPSMFRSIEKFDATVDQAVKKVTAEFQVAQEVLVLVKEKKEAGRKIIEAKRPEKKPEKSPEPRPTTSPPAEAEPEPRRDLPVVHPQAPLLRALENPQLMGAMKLSRIASRETVLGRKEKKPALLAFKDQRLYYPIPQEPKPESVYDIRSRKAPDLTGDRKNNLDLIDGYASVVDYRQVIALCIDASNRYPGEIAFREKLVFALINMNMGNEARKQLDIIKRTKNLTDKDRKWLRFAEAVYLCDSARNHREAQEIFLQLLSERYWVERIYFNTGATHLWLGEYDDAIECYKNAKQLGYEKKKMDWSLGCAFLYKGIKEKSNELRDRGKGILEEVLETATTSELMRITADLTAAYRHQDEINAAPLEKALIEIALGKSSPQARANILWMLGDLHRVDSLKQIIEGMPQDAEPGLQDALHYARLQAETHEGNIEAAKEALAATTDDMSLRQELVNVFLSRGRYEEAHLHSRRMLDILNSIGEKSKPLDYYRSLVLHTTGIIYNLQEDYQSAVSYLERAMELAPDEEGRALIAYDLGTAYLKRKELIKALDYFTAALEMNKKIDNPYIRMHSRLGLADTQHDLGNNEKAIEIIKEIIKEIESKKNEIDKLGYFLSVLSNYYMDCYFRNRKYLEEAKSAAQRALDISQDSPAVVRHFAYILRETGDYDKALEYFERARRLGFGDDAQLVLDFALCCREKGDYETALDMLDMLMKYPDEKAVALSEVATINFLRGRFEQARVYLGLTREAGYAGLDLDYYTAALALQQHNENEARKIYTGMFGVEDIGPSLSGFGITHLHNHINADSVVTFLSMLALEKNGINGNTRRNIFRLLEEMFPETASVVFENFIEKIQNELRECRFDEAGQLIKQAETLRPDNRRIGEMKKVMRAAETLVRQAREKIPEIRSEEDYTSVTGLLTGAARVLVPVAGHSPAAAALQQEADRVIKSITDRDAIEKEAQESFAEAKALLEKGDLLGAYKAALVSQQKFGEINNRDGREEAKNIRADVRRAGRELLGNSSDKDIGIAPQTLKKLLELWQYIAQSEPDNASGAQEPYDRTRNLITSYAERYLKDAQELASKEGEEFERSAQRADQLFKTAVNLWQLAAASEPSNEGYQNKRQGTEEAFLAFKIKGANRIITAKAPSIIRDENDAALAAKVLRSIKILLPGHELAERAEELSALVELVQGAIGKGAFDDAEELLIPALDYTPGREVAEALLEQINSARPKPQSVPLVREETPPQEDAHIALAAEKILTKESLAGLRESANELFEAGNWQDALDAYENLIIGITSVLPTIGKKDVKKLDSWEKTAKKRVGLCVLYDLTEQGEFDEAEHHLRIIRDLLSLPEFEQLMGELQSARRQGKKDDATMPTRIGKGRNPIAGSAYIWNLAAIVGLTIIILAIATGLLRGPTAPFVAGAAAREPMFAVILYLLSVGLFTTAAVLVYARRLKSLYRAYLESTTPLPIKRIRFTVYLFFESMIFIYLCFTTLVLLNSFDRGVYGLLPSLISEHLATIFAAGIFYVFKELFNELLLAKNLQKRIISISWLYWVLATIVLILYETIGDPGTPDVLDIPLPMFFIIIFSLYDIFNMHLTQKPSKEKIEIQHDKSKDGFIVKDDTGNVNEMFEMLAGQNIIRLDAERNKIYKESLMELKKKIEAMLMNIRSWEELEDRLTKKALNFVDRKNAEKKAKKIVATLKKLLGEKVAFNKGTRNKIAELLLSGLKESDKIGFTRSIVLSSRNVPRNNGGKMPDRFILGLNTTSKEVRQAIMRSKSLADLLEPYNIVFAWDLLRHLAGEKKTSIEAQIYMLHEAICPIFGHTESRILQMVLIPDDNDGHPEGTTKDGIRKFIDYKVHKESRSNIPREFLNMIDELNYPGYELNKRRASEMLIYFLENIHISFDFRYITTKTFKEYNIEKLFDFYKGNIYEMASSLFPGQYDSVPGGVKPKELDVKSIWLWKNKGLNLAPGRKLRVTLTHKGPSWYPTFIDDEDGEKKVLYMIFQGLRNQKSCKGKEILLEVGEDLNNGILLRGYLMQGETRGKCVYEYRNRDRFSGEWVQAYPIDENYMAIKDILDARVRGRARYRSYGRALLSEVNDTGDEYKVNLSRHAGAHLFHDKRAISIPRHIGEGVGLKDRDKVYIMVEQDPNCGSVINVYDAKGFERRSNGDNGKDDTWKENLPISTYWYDPVLGEYRLLEKGMGAFDALRVLNGDESIIPGRAFDWHVGPGGRVSFRYRKDDKRVSLFTFFTLPADLRDKVVKFIIETGEDGKLIVAAYDKEEFDKAGNEYDLRRARKAVIRFSEFRDADWTSEDRLALGRGNVSAKDTTALIRDIKRILDGKREGIEIGRDTYLDLNLCKKSDGIYYVSINDKNASNGKRSIFLTRGLAPFIKSVIEKAKEEEETIKLRLSIADDYVFGPYVQGFLVAKNKNESPERLIERRILSYVVLDEGEGAYSIPIEHARLYNYVTEKIKAGDDAEPLNLPVYVGASADYKKRSLTLDFGGPERSLEIIIPTSAIDRIKEKYGKEERYQPVFVPVKKAKDYIFYIFERREYDEASKREGSIIPNLILPDKVYKRGLKSISEGGEERSKKDFVTDYRSWMEAYLPYVKNYLFYNIDNSQAMTQITSFLKKVRDNELALELSRMLHTKPKDKKKAMVNCAICYMLDCMKISCDEARNIVMEFKSSCEYGEDASDIKKKTLVYLDAFLRIIPRRPSEKIKHYAIYGNPAFDKYNEQLIPLEPATFVPPYVYKDFFDPGDRFRGARGTKYCKLTFIPNYIGGGHYSFSVYKAEEYKKNDEIEPIAVLVRDAEKQMLVESSFEEEAKKTNVPAKEPHTSGRRKTSDMSIKEQIVFEINGLISRIRRIVSLLVGGNNIEISLNGGTSAGIWEGVSISLDNNRDTDEGELEWISHYNDVLRRMHARINGNGLAPGKKKVLNAEDYTVFIKIIKIAHKYLINYPYVEQSQVARNIEILFHCVSELDSFLSVPEHFIRESEELFVLMKFVYERDKHEMEEVREFDYRTLASYKARFKDSRVYYRALTSVMLAIKGVEAIGTELDVSKVYPSLLKGTLGYFTEMDGRGELAHAHIISNDIQTEYFEEMLPIIIELAIASEKFGYSNIQSGMREVLNFVYERAERDDSVKALHRLYQEVKKAAADGTLENKRGSLTFRFETVDEGFMNSSDALARRVFRKLFSEYLPSIRSSSDTFGDLMGKLFRDKEARNQIKEGITAKEEDGFLVFYEGENILYTKDGKPAKVRLTGEVVTLAASGQQIRIIEDNENIRGFGDKNNIYLAKGLSEDGIATFHELMESAFAKHPQALPQGVNSHTCLRGCGKDIRNLLKGKETRIANFTAERLISLIKTNLPENRHNETEFNLIRYNESKGKKGIELIYGEQDFIFGANVNDEFSERIKGKPQLLLPEPKEPLESPKESVLFTDGPKDKPTNLATDLLTRFVKSFSQREERPLFTFISKKMDKLLILLEALREKVRNTLPQSMLLTNNERRGILNTALTNLSPSGNLQAYNARAAASAQNYATVTGFTPLAVEETQAAHPEVTVKLDFEIDSKELLTSLIKALFNRNYKIVREICSRVQGIPIEGDIPDEILVDALVKHISSHIRLKPDVGQWVVDFVFENSLPPQEGVNVEYNKDAEDELSRRFPELMTNLTASPERLKQLLFVLSFLRLAWNFGISSYSLYPSLEWAKEHKAVYRLFGDIYVCPIAESFRRHIIFRDSAYGALNAIELKIEGAQPDRWVSYDNFAMPREFERYFVRPLFDLNFESKEQTAFVTYGDKGSVSVLAGKPVRIVGFDYPFDGKRVSNFLGAVIGQSNGHEFEIANAIAQEVLEAVYVAHDKSWLWGSDLHLENWRIGGDFGALRVINVGDTESFSPLASRQEQKEEQERIINALTQILYALVGIRVNELVRQGLDRLNNPCALSGNLMGKLYDKLDKTERKLVAEGIIAKESGDKKFLHFYRLIDGREMPLYTKDGEEAEIRMVGRPEDRDPETGYKIIIIEENENIRGFGSAKGILYLTPSLRYNRRVRYHEGKEVMYAADPGKLPPDFPQGLNVHTYLRGCGKDIRIFLKEALIKQELVPDFTAEELIQYLEAVFKDGRLPQERYNPAEFALIKYNAKKFSAIGIALLYGEEDRDESLGGPQANEAFRFVTRKYLLEQDAQLNEEVLELGVDAPFLEKKGRYKAESLVALWNNPKVAHLHHTFREEVLSLLKSVPIYVNAGDLKKKAPFMGQWLDMVLQNKTLFESARNAGLDMEFLQKSWDYPLEPVRISQIVKLAEIAVPELKKREEKASSVQRRTQAANFIRYREEGEIKHWHSLPLPVKKGIIELLICKLPGKDRLSQLTRYDFEEAQIVDTGETLENFLHSYGDSINNMIEELGDVVIEKSRAIIEKEAVELLAKDVITWEKIMPAMKRYLIEVLIKATPGKDRLSQLSRMDFLDTKILNTRRTLDRLYQFYEAKYPEKSIEGMIEELGDVGGDRKKDIVVEKRDKDIEKEAAKLLKLLKTKRKFEWDKIMLRMRICLVKALIKAVPGKDRLSQLTEDDFRTSILRTKYSIHHMFLYYENTENIMKALGGDIVVEKPQRTIREEAKKLLKQGKADWPNIMKPMLAYLIRLFIETKRLLKKYRHVTDLSQLQRGDFPDEIRVRKVRTRLYRSMIDHFITVEEIGRKIQEESGVKRADDTRGGGMMPIVSAWLVKHGYSLKWQALIEQGGGWTLNIIAQVFGNLVLPGTGGIIGTALIWSGFFAIHFIKAKDWPHAPPWKGALGITALNILAFTIASSITSFILAFSIAALIHYVISLYYLSHIGLLKDKPRSNLFRMLYDGLKWLLDNSYVLRLVFRYRPLVPFVPTDVFLEGRMQFVVGEETPSDYVKIAEETIKFIKRNKEKFLAVGLHITSCEGFAYEFHRRLVKKWLNGGTLGIFFWMESVHGGLYQVWVETKDGFVIYYEEETGEILIDKKENLEKIYPLKFMGESIDTCEKIFAAGLRNSRKKWIRFSDLLDSETRPLAMILERVRTKKKAGKITPMAAAKKIMRLKKEKQRVYLDILREGVRQNDNVSGEVLLQIVKRSLLRELAPLQPSIKKRVTYEDAAIMLEMLAMIDPRRTKEIFEIIEYLKKDDNIQIWHQIESVRDADRESKRMLESMNMQDIGLYAMENFKTPNGLDFYNFNLALIMTKTANETAYYMANLPREYRLACSRFCRFLGNRSKSFIAKKADEAIQAYDFMSEIQYAIMRLKAKNEGPTRQNIAAELKMEFETFNYRCGKFGVVKEIARGLGIRSEREVASKDLSQANPKRRPTLGMLGPRFLLAFVFLTCAGFHAEPGALTQLLEWAIPLSIFAAFSLITLGLLRNRLDLIHQLIPEGPRLLFENVMYAEGKEGLTQKAPVPISEAEGNERRSLAQRIGNSKIGIGKPEFAKLIKSDGKNQAIWNSPRYRWELTLPEDSYYSIFLKDERDENYPYSILFMEFRDRAEFYLVRMLKDGSNRIDYENEPILIGEAAFNEITVRGRDSVNVCRYVEEFRRRWITSSKSDERGPCSVNITDDNGVNVQATLMPDNFYYNLIRKGRLSYVVGDDSIKISVGDKIYQPCILIEEASLIKKLRRSSKPADGRTVFAAGYLYAKTEDVLNLLVENNEIAETLETFLWLLCGLDSQEIARQMGITSATVVKHKNQFRHVLSSRTAKEKGIPREFERLVKKDRILQRSIIERFGRSILDVMLINLQSLKSAQNGEASLCLLPIIDWNDEIEKFYKKINEKFRVTFTPSRFWNIWQEKGLSKYVPLKELPVLLWLMFGLSTRAIGDGKKENDINKLYEGITHDSYSTIRKAFEEYLPEFQDALRDGDRNGDKRDNAQIIWDAIFKEFPQRVTRNIWPDEVDESDVQEIVDEIENMLDRKRGGIPRGLSGKTVEPAIKDRISYEIKLLEATSVMEPEKAIEETGRIKKDAEKESLALRDLEPDDFEKIKEAAYHLEEKIKESQKKAAIVATSGEPKVVIRQVTPDDKIPPYVPSTPPQYGRQTEKDRERMKDLAMAMVIAEKRAKPYIGGGEKWNEFILDKVLRSNRRKVWAFIGEVIDVYKLEGLSFETRVKLLETYLLGHLFYIKQPTRRDRNLRRMRRQVSMAALEELLVNSDTDIFQPVLDSIVVQMTRLELQYEKRHNYWKKKDIDMLYRILKDTVHEPGFARAMVSELVRTAKHRIKLVEGISYKDTLEAIVRVMHRVVSDYPEFHKLHEEFLDEFSRVNLTTLPDEIRVGLTGLMVKISLDSPELIEEAEQLRKNLVSGITETGKPVEPGSVIPPFAQTAISEPAKATDVTRDEGRGTRDEDEPVAKEPRDEGRWTRDDKEKRRIAIIGASGFLGKKLYRTLNDFYTGVIGTYCTKPSDEFVLFDVTDDERVKNFIQTYLPDVIIYAGGESDPRKAELDPTRAELLNIHAIDNIAKYFKGHFIYISSDYVFDGTNPPYSADSLARPLNIYGKSKLAGEQKTLVTYAKKFKKATVVRIGVLYGYNDESDKSTFVKEMVQKLANNVLSIVVDNAQVRHPTFIDDVAEHVLKVIKSGQTGITQINGNESVTKYQWSKMIEKTYSELAQQPSQSKIEPATIVDSIDKPMDAHMEQVTSIKPTPLEQGTRQTVFNLLKSIKQSQAISAPTGQENPSPDAADEITKQVSEIPAFARPMHERLESVWNNILHESLWGMWDDFIKRFVETSVTHLSFIPEASNLCKAVKPRLLVLDADALLEHIALFDFEETLKMLKKRNVLGGGELVLYVKDPALNDKAKQLGDYIEIAVPGLKAAVVTQDQCQGRIKEWENDIPKLIEELKKALRRSDIKTEDVFAVVRGNKGNCVDKFNYKAEAPLILLNYNGTDDGKKAFYSFAGIVREAMQAYIDSSREGFRGWVKILDPITRITQEMYEEYIRYRDYIMTKA